MSEESANRAFKKAPLSQASNSRNEILGAFIAFYRCCNEYYAASRSSKGTTPFEVHFERKPHWESGAVAKHVPIEESDDEWVEIDVLEPEKVLREHEKMVSLEKPFGLDITGYTGKGERCGRDA